jgi:hypothetical protein
MYSKPSNYPINALWKLRHTTDNTLFVDGQLEYRQFDWTLQCGLVLTQQF